MSAHKVTDSFGSLQADEPEIWDTELSNHVLSFILVVLSSPEAPSNANLRRRFAVRMLECGEQVILLPASLVPVCNNLNLMVPSCKMLTFAAHQLEIIGSRSQAVADDWYPDAMLLCSK